MCVTDGLVVLGGALQQQDKVFHAAELVQKRLRARDMVRDLMLHPATPAHACTHRGVVPERQAGLLGGKRLNEERRRHIAQLQSDTLINQ